MPVDSSFVNVVDKKLEVPFFGPLDVMISTPKERPLKHSRNKTPISIHISNDGSLNAIGCYMYSIVGRSGEIHSTILNNSTESLLDLTKKVSTLISKRYNSPAYVNVNGSFSIDEFTPIIGSLIKEIELCYTSDELAQ